MDSRLYVVPLQVDKLLKTEDGKVSGARVKDMVTGAEWDVKVLLCKSQYLNIISIRL